MALIPAGPGVNTGQYEMAFPMYQLLVKGSDNVVRVIRVTGIAGAEYSLNEALIDAIIAGLPGEGYTVEGATRWELAYENIT